MLGTQAEYQQGQTNGGLDLGKWAGYKEHVTCDKSKLRFTTVTDDFIKDRSFSVQFDCFSSAKFQPWKDSVQKHPRLSLHKIEEHLLYDISKRSHVWRNQSRHFSFMFGRFEILLLPQEYSPESFKACLHKSITFPHVYIMYDT